MVQQPNAGGEKTWRSPRRIAFLLAEKRRRVFPKLLSSVLTPSMASPASPSRTPRLIVRTVIVLALLAGAVFGGRAAWRQVSPGMFGAKRGEKIPTVKVRTASIAEEIVAVGRLRAVFSTELRSEINGRIVKIMAIDGQKLQRDQEILKLDQQDLLTQIQEIDRSIEAAKLRSQRARRDHERQLDLQKRGV